ncbi:unnamed protein product [Owenia fusiformis]|uniref:Centrobin n=1 Tax=Owenia fusiformis TaxID=6347 RepID=A0A8S4NJC2_OWEFU|nr:unnamed protein product [Owenia fusiformis]
MASFESEVLSDGDTEDLIDGVEALSVISSLHSTPRFSPNASPSQKLTSPGRKYTQGLKQPQSYDGYTRSQPGLSNQSTLTTGRIPDRTSQSAPNSPAVNTQQLVEEIKRKVAASEITLNKYQTAGTPGTRTQLFPDSCPSRKYGSYPDVSSKITHGSEVSSAHMKQSMLGPSGAPLGKPPISQSQAIPMSHDISQRHVPSQHGIEDDDIENKIMTTPSRAKPRLLDEKYSRDDNYGNKDEFLVEKSEKQQVNYAQQVYEDALQRDRENEEKLEIYQEELLSPRNKDDIDTGMSKQAMSSENSTINKKVRSPHTTKLSRYQNNEAKQQQNTQKTQKFTEDISKYTKDTSKFTSDTSKYTSDTSKYTSDTSKYTSDTSNTYHSFEGSFNMDTNSLQNYPSSRMQKRQDQNNKIDSNSKPHLAPQSQKSPPWNKDILPLQSRTKSDLKVSNTEFKPLNSNQRLSSNSSYSSPVIRDTNCQSDSETSRYAFTGGPYVGLEGLASSPGLMAAAETIKKDSFSSMHSKDTSGVTSFDIKEMEHVRGHIQSMLNSQPGGKRTGKSDFDHTNDVESLLAGGAETVTGQKDESFGSIVSSTILGSKNLMDSSPTYGRYSDNLLYTENQQLRESLEKEKYRRRHCEKQIQQLQAKMLEVQQQLAVAVSTDKRKDSMIEQLDKTLAKVVEGWKRHEAEKQEMIEKLNAEKKLAEQVQKDHQKMVKGFEEEVANAMRQVAAEREKMSHIEQEKQSYIEKLDQERGQLVTLLESEQERIRRIEAERDRAQDGRQHLEKQTESLQTTLNQERAGWAEKEKEFVSKIDEITTMQIQVLKKEQDRVDEQQRASDESKQQLAAVQNQYRQLQVDFDSLSRDKESLKVELGLMDARLKSSKRKLEMDMKAQLEKEISQKLEDAHQKMAAVEADLQEVHRKHVVELTQRHSREMESQLQQFHEEMRRKDAHIRQQIQQYDDRLTESLAEISSLKAQNRQIDMQKRNIAAKLQNLMHSHVNEAMLLLGATDSPDRGQVLGGGAPVYTSPGRESNLDSVSVHSNRPIVTSNSNIVTSQSRIVTSQINNQSQMTTGASLNVPGVNGDHMARFLQSLPEQPRGVGVGSMHPRNNPVHTQYGNGDGSDVAMTTSMSASQNQGQRLSSNQVQGHLLPSNQMQGQKLPTNQNQGQIPASAYHSQGTGDRSQAEAQRSNNTWVNNYTTTPMNSSLIANNANIPSGDGSEIGNLPSARSQSSQLNMNSSYNQLRNTSRTQHNTVTSQRASDGSYNQHVVGHDKMAATTNRNVQGHTNYSGAQLLHTPNIQNSQAYLYNTNTQQHRSHIGGQGQDTFKPLLQESDCSNIDGKSDTGDIPPGVSTGPISETSSIHDNTLTEQYDDMTQKFDDHELKQNELQHYIKMLLNKSPGDPVDGSTKVDVSNEQSADPLLTPIKSRPASIPNRGVAAGAAHDKPQDNFTPAFTHSMVAPTQGLQHNVELSPKQVGEISRLLKLYKDSHQGELSEDPPIDELLTYFESIHHSDGLPVSSGSVTRLPSQSQKTKPGSKVKQNLGPRYKKAEVDAKVKQLLQQQKQSEPINKLDRGHVIKATQLRKTKSSVKSSGAAWK